jgi:hypothetical protein
MFQLNYLANIGLLHDMEKLIINVLKQNQGKTLTSHEILEILRESNVIKTLKSYLDRYEKSSGFKEPASHIGAVASQLAQNYPNIKHTTSKCSVLHKKEDAFIYCI